MSDTRIQVRLSEELAGRLEKACKATGLEQPFVVKTCLEAFCDYVEENKKVTFPFVLTPKEIPEEEYQVDPADLNNEIQGVSDQLKQFRAKLHQYTAHQPQNLILNETPNSDAKPNAIIEDMANKSRAEDKSHNHPKP